MVTFEIENVPAAVVERLSALGVEVARGALRPGHRPGPHRGEDLPQRPAACRPSAFAAVAERGRSRRRPSTGSARRRLLKTRREGYDGKGQTWVEAAADAEAAFARIGGDPAILESRADFRRELSIIAARGRDGEIACYPLAENHHENGVLRRTARPGRGPRGTSPRRPQRIAATHAGAPWTMSGVIGVELFEHEDGRLLVNEFAPRVHNTGHWTLDGCEVDQFEQHLRAICGWPLGPTEPLARVEMENLLGDGGRRTGRRWPPSRRPASGSTASARPFPAARWATSTG